MMVWKIQRKCLRETILHCGGEGGAHCAVKTFAGNVVNSYFLRSYVPSSKSWGCGNAKIKNDVKQNQTKNSNKKDKVLTNKATAQCHLHDRVTEGRDGL